MYEKNTRLTLDLFLGITFLATASLSSAQVSLTVQSEGIVQGKIAKPHACRKMGGQDLAPALSITGIPSEAKFVAIVADDPDAVSVAGKTWVHWNWFNIPAMPTLTIDAGKTPQGDAGKTSQGKGYEGMCPPNGTHTYRFAVFAMSERVDVSGFLGPTAMTIESFESKYKSAIVGKGEITGQF